MNSALATCELPWKTLSDGAYVGSRRHAMGVRSCREPGFFRATHLPTDGQGDRARSASVPTVESDQPDVIPVTSRRLRVWQD